MRAYHNAREAIEERRNEPVNRVTSRIGFHARTFVAVYSVFISRPFQPTTYYFNLGRFDKALAISSVKGITVLFFSPEISTSVCR